MRHNLVLYISVCLMQVIILSNITLFDGQWNGIICGYVQPYLFSLPQYLV